MAASRTRVILLSCGSFNPVTFMHLQMFAIAREVLTKNGLFSVVEGIISPVHDDYKKKGLVKSEHRMAMCRMALETSDWIHLDDWESNQECWKETVKVLDHVTELARKKYKGPNPVIVKLLCGTDLLETFTVPNLWADKDVNKIIGEHGLVVIPRTGSNPELILSKSDNLTKHKNNIHIITEWTPNDISSTKIRQALCQNETVKNLIPDKVIEYVKANNLYQVPDT